MNKLIDVWDTGTFDPGLMTQLTASAQLIINYLTTDRRQFEEREASVRWMPHATNPYGQAYMDFVEAIGRDFMQSRTIRAWHYTRLVGDEVRIIRENGIYPGTLDTLRRRLDALVATGTLTAADADALYAASPCHHREQQPGRLGKFWMTSDPVLTDDGGVGPTYNPRCRWTTISEALCCERNPCCQYVGCRWTTISEALCYSSTLRQ